MPSGLVDALTHQEQLDLFRFLSELGKPGPFDASKGNVARYWKVAADSIHAEQFGDKELTGSDLSGAQWHSVFSLVDGRVPKKEWHVAGTPDHSGSVPHYYIGTKFRSVKAGVCHFKFPDAAGAAVWVDGKAVPIHETISVELSSGTHTIVIKFDAQKVPDYVRLQFR